MATIRRIKVKDDGSTTTSERSLVLDRAETNTDVPRRIAMIPLLKSKVYNYKDGASRTSFEPAEYDFNEILTAEDAEAYFARGVEKKSNLMFKEGYQVVSRNPDTQKYMDIRLSQTERAQGKPWKQLLKDVGRDLNKFANGMLVKSRDRRASGGFPRPLPSRGGQRRMVEPIAAYFHLPMETIEFRRNDAGEVTHVRQMMPDGRKRVYPIGDIVHFYINKKTGWSVGTPTIVPVLDDIRTLRRMEENIDLLVYQNLFPLFQYKVGTADRPAQMYPDGTSEIDMVRSEISFMPPEGVLVTPERHEIDLIGSEGRALRAENYLTHFKLRVFAGLGMSAVDFGEGATANKATAAQLSIQLIDTVKAVQYDFATQFNFLVLDELLAEGRFDYDPLLAENRSNIVFHEIDIDKKIKMEEHAADIFTKKLIMEDEARIMVGLDALEVQDERRELSYFSLYEEPITQLKGSLSPMSPLASAAANNTQTKIEASDIEVGQKNKVEAGPDSSQSASSDPEAKKVDALSFAPRAAFKDHMVREAFGDLLRDIQYHLSADSPRGWIDSIVDAWSADLSRRMLSVTIARFRSGVSSTGLDRWEHDFSQQLRQLENRLADTIGRLGFDVKRHLERISPDAPLREVMSAIDISMNRINAIFVTERATAYNLGIVEALKIQGVELFTTEIHNNEPCQACVSASRLTLNLNTATIDQIPPHHPFCQCGIISAGELNG